MSSLDQNRDIELLRKYYNGKLSDAEKNSLEQRALEDPFLKEAMDGFDENPEGFNQFDARHIKANSGAGRTMLVAVVVILAMGVTTVLINNNFYRDEVIASTDTDSTSIENYIEVEILPIELETLEVVTEDEQITVEEILENKIKIEEARKADKEADPKPDDAIEIDMVDNNIEDDDFHPEDENPAQNLENSAPATYLHKLYVVDYREIMRTKEYISYKRYDLPGTSADKENEGIDYNEDLIEREVNVPYMDYLEGGMEYFKIGKFKKALNRYRTILEQYDKDMNALFYGGLCFYNMKKYENALNSFDGILNHELNAFKEEAKWYKAKTLLKLGRRTEARDVLDQVIIQGGFYLKDAIIVRKSL